MNTIQWFPGHMAKAKREALEKIKMVDVVIELLDARIPESSRNPLIDTIIGNRPHVVVLNKSDLAKSNETRKWLEYFKNRAISAVEIDAQHGKGIKQLKKEIELIMQPVFENYQKKGVKPRPIRLMILGIPNVGKSTLINRFVGKNQAITGNKPGVTKAQRWLKVSQQFELLDTPGILWPKFEDPDVGKKLALTGAIKDTLFHKDDIALYLLEWMKQYYPQQLTDYTKINQKEWECYPTSEMLMRITFNMGYKEDYERASERIINDFRQLKMGTITLDLCPEGGNYEEGVDN